MALMDIDSWPPFGGQLQGTDADCFSGQFFLGSDDGECHLFNDDISYQCQQTVPGWPFIYEVNNLKSFNGQSSPDDYDLGFPAPTDSPSTLSGSPEQFIEIDVSQCLDQESPAVVPVLTNRGNWFPACGTPKPSSDPAVAEFFSDVFSEENVPLVDDDDKLLFELDDLITDDVIDHEKLAGVGTELPPVSIDDVLSLLPSDKPASAETTSFDSLGTPTPFSVSVTGSPESPNSVNVLLMLPSMCCGAATELVYRDRRQRKKQQNKSAAQRYREKKRGEHGNVMTEYEELERRNVELRTRVDSLAKEIAYLKGLIEEICS